MDIYIQHVVGWCPVCFAPILDNGRDNNADQWEHAMPVIDAGLPPDTPLPARTTP